MTLSQNALTRSNTYHIIRVRGKVKNNALHILIDSRSTHNLLDLATAKKSGCHIKNTCPLEVAVANDSWLFSNSMRKNFKWQL